MPLFTDDAAFDSAARYFRLPVLSVRPWSFGSAEIQPPTDVKRATLSLREARARTESMAADATNAVQQYLDADGKLLNAHRAEALFEAGFFIAADTFDLPAAGQQGVDQLRAVEEPRRNEALRFLDRYEDMIRLRMGTALRLLRLRHIIDRVATGTMKDPTGPVAVAQFVNRLYTALHTMDQTRGQFESLRNLFAEAFILLFNLSSQPTNQNIIQQAQPRVTRVHDELVRLQTQFEGAAFPFDSTDDSAANNDAETNPKPKKKTSQGTKKAKGINTDNKTGTRNGDKPPTMKDILLPTIAPIAQVDQLLLQAEQWLNNFAHLHHRTLAHLSAICAKVEIASGLPPLPPILQSPLPLGEG